jgi:hypothetical protein
VFCIGITGKTTLRQLVGCIEKEVGFKFLADNHLKNKNNRNSTENEVGTISEQ